jgi:hypothetical protein
MESKSTLQNYLSMPTTCCRVKDQMIVVSKLPLLESHLRRVQSFGQSAKKFFVKSREKKHWGEIKTLGKLSKLICRFIYLVC